MAAQSAFRGVIDFFNEIGIFDVVLPFLLVFTIVFAILEKTKVLGYEEIDKVHYTKKNLNSMVAFVIAFLVVASTKLVAIINQTMSQVVLLMLLAVCFLMLVGVFLGDKEFKLDWKDPWMIFFTFFMFIGILLIFLQAIKNDSGKSWLEIFWDFIMKNWSSQAVGAVILMILIIGFMWYIVSDNKPKGESKS